MIEDVLCDKCYGNVISDKPSRLCNECAQKMDCYCFVCDTLQDEPVDYVCDSCIEEMNRPRTMRGGCIITNPALITKWEFPEL